MVNQSKDNVGERQPVRRGKYKVHDEKVIQQNKKDVEDEAIDEAAMESFPASDPPSWSATTGEGGRKEKGQ